MERVLEPELMTEEENARAYAGADFADAHQGYVRLFAETFPDAPPEAVALDLGCGPGDVTFRFARAFPRWVFHAVDGSAAMLGQAQRILESEPDVAARVRLIPGVLPGAALPAAFYSVVLSTSLLHHLPDPQALWRTVRRHGAPGALVLVADLSRPGTADEASALIDRYAAGEPGVLRRDFYHSLLAAFTPAEVEGQLADAGLTALRVRTISDRHLVVWGRLGEAEPGSCAGEDSPEVRRM